MSKRKKFMKYQNCDASLLTLVKFGKLDPGNLFYMEDYKYEMLLICINERKDVKFDRNCVVIVAKDKGYCGLGFWLADDDDVYVIEDTNVLLRGYLL